MGAVGVGVVCLATVFATACGSGRPTPEHPSATRATAERPEARPSSRTASAPAGLELRCADPQDCPASVGMLVFAADAEPERCTASLVGPDQILTASHCVRPTLRHAGASCRGAWVLFARTGSFPARWVECAEVVSAAPVDDAHVLRPDQALLRLGRSVDRPALSIVPEPVEPGSIVTVVSIAPHPIYRSQHRLSTRLCRVWTSDLAEQALGPEASQVGWLLDCPILPGNSGSPVLDHAGHVRAIVHAGSNPGLGIGVTSPPTAAAP